MSKGAGVDQSVVSQVIEALVAKYGAKEKDRIGRGVAQVARYWRAEDGDGGAFAQFCQTYFIPSGEGLREAFARFEANMEAMRGYEVMLTRKLREPLDLSSYDPLPFDILFGALNPFDHLVEDAFKTMVAFVALLNFPLRNPLELEKEWKGGQLSRDDLAAARLTERFALRIPGEAKQAETEALNRAGHYIDEYNIYTDRLLFPNRKVALPRGPRLISHWGLRDHIKALYADAHKNLPVQRLIQKVMERIIYQEIPKEVINSNQYFWDPIGDRLFQKVGRELRQVEAHREPDTRYQYILEVFAAERMIDQYSPAYPTYIKRRFELDRQMTEDRVRQLLVDLLSADVARDVASLIRERLGRPLEPFDIWYDGFKVRGTIPERRLDAVVSKRFATLAAFSEKLPETLRSLGFSEAKADFLARHIAVDPARGAGHAWGAGMRGDKAHLRTRVPGGGMDYKGFNIAMHELGHTVEQTFSLYEVDHVLLSGVPNNAFTEAIAFLFQQRDLKVLGLERPDPETRALKTLDVFWSTREIAGVALVDMAVWRYMYDHPDCTKADLREATIKAAKEVWNKYFAPIIGVKDSPILAIYSHMVAYALYLPDYPLGFLIQFQLEKHLGGKDFGAEIERISRQGRLTPDAWMVGAVGSVISPEPLLKAASEAVDVARTHADTR